MATFSVYTSGYPLSGVPVGTSWGVDISGLAPGAVVWAYQIKPDGTPLNVYVGLADSAGNFTHREPLGAWTLGTWHTTWVADGLAVGSYVFTSIPAFRYDPNFFDATTGQPIAPAGVSNVPLPATLPIAPAAAAAPPSSADASQPRGLSPLAVAHGRRRVEPMAIGVGAIGVGAAGGPIGIAIGVAVTIGSILGGLFGGLFGGGGVSMDQIDSLRQAIVDIGNTITAAVAAVMRCIGKILKFLKWIWDDVIHPILDQLRKILERLGTLIKEVIPKMLDWLQRLRATIMRIYEKFLRPIIIIIQKLHQILTILKLFHIKWAARLDDKLMRLESKLTAPLLFVLKQINTIANVLNLVLDSRVLLQRTIHLGSLIDHRDGWIPIWWQGQSNPVSDADLAARRAANSFKSDAEIEADFVQYLRTGDGPMQDDVEAGFDSLVTYRG